MLLASAYRILSESDPLLCSYEVIALLQMADVSRVGFHLWQWYRPPTKCNWYLYLVLKFRVDRIYSFGYISISIFWRFALKRATGIRAHLWEFSGHISLNGAIHRSKSEKDRSCTKIRRLRLWAVKVNEVSQELVQRFYLDVRSRKKTRHAADGGQKVTKLWTPLRRFEPQFGSGSWHCHIIMCTLYNILKRNCHGLPFYRRSNFRLSWILLIFVWAFVWDRFCTGVRTKGEWLCCVTTSTLANILVHRAAATHVGWHLFGGTTNRSLICRAVLFKDDLCHLRCVGNQFRHRRKINYSCAALGLPAGNWILHVSSRSSVVSGCFNQKSNWIQWKWAQRMNKIKRINQLYN